MTRSVLFGPSNSTGTGTYLAATGPLSRCEAPNAAPKDRYELGSLPLKNDVATKDSYLVGRLVDCFDWSVEWVAISNGQIRNGTDL